jgi:hypothetical protein
MRRRVLAPFDPIRDQWSLLNGSGPFWGALVFITILTPFREYRRLLENWGRALCRSIRF